MNGPLMKTFLRSIYLLLGILLLAASPSFGRSSIEVIISGSSENIEAFSEGEIEYISFSELIDIQGGELDWEIVGHTVSYSEGDNHFLFLIGSPLFTLYDSVFNMTYPARLKDGQLFLPAVTFIPFLDQVLLQQITYSPKSGKIRIDSEYFNVTDMAISPKANGLLIEIFTTSVLAYDVFLTEGNWINVSIRDGRLNSPRILSRKNSRFMYRLKTHQSPETGQISFRLRKNVDKWHHKIAYDPPRIQISIADVQFDIETVDSAPLLGPDDKIDVIVIDPGHGGSDYGAIGQKGTREKDVALNIGKELAKLIRKDKQFKVIMTRDRDQTIDLAERASIANKATADLFISIHANSSPKKHVRGWNVFFLAQARNDSARAVAQLENSSFVRKQRASVDNSGDEYFDDPILGILNEMIMTEFQAESHDFAMMVDREMRRSVRIPARGVDQAGFFVLNKVFTPSVLVEVGFISNKNEEKLLKKKDYHKKVAKAIYKAIKRFKLKYESN